MRLENYLVHTGKRAIFGGGGGGGGAHNMRPPRPKSLVTWGPPRPQIVSDLAPLSSIGLPLRHRLVRKTCS